MEQMVQGQGQHCFGWLAFCLHILQSRSLQSSLCRLWTGGALWKANVGIFPDSETSVKLCLTFTLGPHVLPWFPIFHLGEVIYLNSVTPPHCFRLNVLSWTGFGFLCRVLPEFLLTSTDRRPQTRPLTPELQPSFFPFWAAVSIGNTDKGSMAEFQTTLVHTGWALWAVYILHRCAQWPCRVPLAPYCLETRVSKCDTKTLILILCLVLW